ncbi:type 4a pilus biogenesis protein PilO [Vibrio tapetis subsp. quintayensis]|uniref:type 4a pilus biogenesis protein PilO n=1 Tax=Vibrio tapetis TaxID=52443 RepID=UPI0025B59403|nr:type 4a pilus biogenesis protein PilO [Vibrio tapetis]MDN3679418.1 type 4a pilus biogenesis protein PilO [Vibrio tapetis subsp. quintayensis]
MNWQDLNFKGLDFGDLDVEELAEWPRLPQALVLIIIVVLIQLAGSWFYLTAENEELTRMIDQEQTLKAQLVAKTHQVAVVPKLNNQLDELNQRYEFLLKQLPEQKELASLLAAVNEQGIKHDLTFTRIDWGQKINQPFLYKLPLNIELTGSYQDIGRFVESIATLPRVINFEDVSWQRVSQESRTLHFRVRAYTYQFKPEVTDEK